MVRRASHKQALVRGNVPLMDPLIFVGRLLVPRAQFHRCQRPSGWLLARLSSSYNKPTPDVLQCTHYIASLLRRSQALFYIFIDPFPPGFSGHRLGTRRLQTEPQSP